MLGDRPRSTANHDRYSSAPLLRGGFTTIRIPGPPGAGAWPTPCAGGQPSTSQADSQDGGGDSDRPVVHQGIEPLEGDLLHRHVPLFDALSVLPYLSESGGQVDGGHFIAEAGGVEGLRQEGPCFR